MSVEIMSNPIIEENPDATLSQSNADIEIESTNTSSEVEPSNHTNGCVAVSGSFRATLVDGTEDTETTQRYLREEAEENEKKEKESDEANVPSSTLTAAAADSYVAVISPKAAAAAAVTNTMDEEKQSRKRKIVDTIKEKSDQYMECVNSLLAETEEDGLTLLIVGVGKHLDSLQNSIDDLIGNLEGTPKRLKAQVCRL